MISSCSDIINPSSSTGLDRGRIRSGPGLHGNGLKEPGSGRGYRVIMPVVTFHGIAVVVFDLDDTLYPEREFAYSGFEAVGRWLRARMHCPSDPSARMRELFDQGHRGRIFDQLLAEWSCPQAASWVPQMVECFRGHNPKIRLFTDAAAALERWQAIFQLSLISDGPVGMQWNKVKALGLESRLRPIIITDQWGLAFRKPHPRAFEAIENETGQRGSRCLYIGDNQSKDFVAPRQLGWRTACLQRSGGIYRAAQCPENGAPEFELLTLQGLTLVP